MSCLVWKLNAWIKVPIRTQHASWRSVVNLLPEVNSVTMRLDCACDFDTAQVKEEFARKCSPHQCSATRP